MVHHLAAIDIGRQRGGLADAQALQLGFPSRSCGVDLGLVQRHHRHHGRTGLHTLAQLHTALGHIAIHGERSVTRCKARYASTREAARATFGCADTEVPSVKVWLALSC